MALTEAQSLRQAIAREEANLTTLEQKQQKSRERLATLRAELAAITSAISIPSAWAKQPSADIPTTPKEKVFLFCNLFHGRSDVYPLLWVSSKTGKKGYSPACGNEWVRGICEKPRVKCSECPNQSFLRDVPMLARMFERRLREYRAIGYTTGKTVFDAKY